MPRLISSRLFCRRADDYFVLLMLQLAQQK